MSPQVQVEITKPIATLRITEPERLHERDGDGWRELATACDHLSARSDVACVVVCTGGDGPVVGPDVAPRDGSDEASGRSDVITLALRAVRACAHPTVAIVEGLCARGWLEVAVCCDLRVCGESSRFSAPIRGRGPDVHEHFDPLAQLLGASPALHMLASGELIDAEGASRFGLVNRVCADASVLAQGYGLAARIAAGAPLVNRWHKRIMCRLHARFPVGELDPAEPRRERRLH
jgi:enoyl-CoA hydratase/carnithine racemase